MVVPGGSQAKTPVLAVGGFDGGQAVAEEGSQAVLQGGVAQRVLLAGIGLAVEQKVAVGGIERGLGARPRRAASSAAAGSRGRWGT